jgi:hypothetical protein
MIKRLTLLSLFIIGSTISIAQSITHAEELKKEALRFTGVLMNGIKSGDKAYTVEEKIVGDKNIKISRNNGKIERIGTQHTVKNKMHQTVYFYKNEKLILSIYSSAFKNEDKKISNFRYYDEKGKCQSSVCKDGIAGDKDATETIGNTKNAKLRMKESKKLMKFAKKGNLEKLSSFDTLEL